MRDVHNFYAGPGALPTTVLERVREDLFSYNGTGVSVMELSHRSDPIVELMDDTTARFRQLLELDDQWEVMLLQGGGTLQFIMVPWNLADAGDRVDYLDTGHWTQQAIKQASKCGRDLEVIASGKGFNYHRLPAVHEITPRAGARFLHLCTNNTVVGTQWRALPSVGTPLVIDASSDLLSRRISLENVSCVYAHAQKNTGLAGVTMVAVRRDALIPNVELPDFFDYRSHIEKKSNFHTPPIFAVYITNLMLDWLENEIGGVDAMSYINDQKAALLYEVLDNSELFSCPTDPADRSKMNVVFATGDDSVDQEFIEMCERNRVIGVAAHRTQKGMRVSLYNAVDLNDVYALIELIECFEHTKMLAVRESLVRQAAVPELVCN